MPLYDYRCPNGHRVELIRPIGVNTVQCSCGVDAERRTVNRVAHIGRAVVPHAQRNYRQSFSEYREAVDEVADSYRRVNDERAPHEGVTAPNYYELAKTKAHTQGAAIK